MTPKSKRIQTCLLCKLGFQSHHWHGVEGEDDVAELDADRAQQVGCRHPHSIQQREEPLERGRWSVFYCNTSRMEADKFQVVPDMKSMGGGCNALG